MDLFFFVIKLFLIEIFKYLNVVIFLRYIVFVMLFLVDGNLVLCLDLD